MVSSPSKVLRLRNNNGFTHQHDTSLASILQPSFLIFELGHLPNVSQKAVGQVRTPTSVIYVGLNLAPAYRREPELAQDWKRP